MKRNLLKIISVTIMLLSVTVGCKKDQNVTNVILDKNNITLTIEKKAILTATIYPEDAANKAVIWASIDESVAEVANGIVTAKKVGITTITVTTEDGNHKAECSIKVIFLTEDEGVVINGVKWATRNVDMPGTFAENPEDAGMFYQWNRKTGWSSTDPMINSDGVTTWDNTDSEGDTWEKANDPCPSGWRVPTHEEQISLANAAQQWTTVNGINAYTFGSDSILLFLPAAGCRFSYNGNLIYVGTYGRYWSSGIASDIHACNLYFNSTDVKTNTYYFRADGFSVRCVAE